jgi:hypothetical protein
VKFLKTNVHPFSTSYSVITFATNKLSYVNLALNCAQSILVHNDIPVYIVTNLDFAIPDKFRNKIFIIQAKAEHVSLGIGMKLHIDEYIQTEYTLFIDSDCLCYGNLNEIFEACEGMDVSVAGNITTTEDWCGSECAVTIKKNHSMNEVIKFNGGLYYIKKTSLSKKIFNEARELAKEYDYGFDKIANKWVTEELAISISMKLNNQIPIPDNGYFMTDLFTDHRPKKLNVLMGSRLLRNPPYHLPQHSPMYPARYSPIILHFGGKNINSYPYKSQRLLLRLYYINIPTPLATTVINIFVHLPYKGYHWIMGSLRKLKANIRSSIKKA